jgi:SAM-dependent methyltransferase
MDWALLRTIFDELTCFKPFDRVPEPNSVMSSSNAVAAFTRASERNGILSGFYAYHIAQSSALVEAGDTVVDLGCGPARLLASIAKLHPRAKFFGIDLSEEMLEEGARFKAISGIANIEFIKDDISSMSSIGSASVDLALSSMSLHHLPDADSLRRCFKAIDRVLKPSGRVYISDLGRLRHSRSIDYFVNRAVPPSEPVLARDYRMSLRAAFSPSELRLALCDGLRERLSIYHTAISPLLIVVTTGQHKALKPALKAALDDMILSLPGDRRCDLEQLRLFLRLGGLQWVK